MIELICAYIAIECEILKKDYFNYDLPVYVTNGSSNNLLLKCLVAVERILNYI